MSSLLIVVAVVAVVALSALALGLFALFQSQSRLRAAGGRGEPVSPQRDAAVEQLQAAVEGLASRIRELEGPTTGAPAYRAGLNLNKRSQALRMHRRGEPPSQIAAALDLPHQEVELLIKVQRIVLSKL